MKRSPRLLVGSVAVVAVSLLAACGDDDDATSTTSAATEVSTAAADSVAGTDSTTGGSVDATVGSDETTPVAGSASGNKDDYVAALADNINLPDRDMAECLGSAVIDEIGFDRIESSGMSPDEFANSGGQLDEKGLAMTPEQADDLKSAFADCGAIAEAFISTESIPDTQKDCERKAITDEVAAEILANQLTGATNSTELEAAEKAALACNTGGSTPTTTG